MPPDSIEAAHDAFLTAVSHELRTPLTSVVGFAETLKSAPLLPAIDRDLMIDRLVENARRLGRLVEDLLDLNLTASGTVRLHRRATNVTALVRGVLEGSDILAARRVEIRGRELVAEIDPAKVERIVEALLANASKHTPPGTPVRIEVESTPGGVLIAVEDRGPGVAADLKEDLFKPFRRGPTAPEHAPGLGIGLSLAARFAEMHGGRAWVEDGAAGGSRFRVFLSAAICDEADEASPAAS